MIRAPRTPWRRPTDHSSTTPDGSASTTPSTNRPTSVRPSVDTVTAVAPAQLIGIDANWPASSTTDEAVQIVRLLDASGDEIARTTDVLGYGIYPPSRWARNEVVRQHSSLRLPKTL